MSNTAQADRRVIALPERPAQEPDTDGVPSPDELGASEADFLRQITAAAEISTEPIAVYRGDTVVMRFTIQTVDAETYETIRKLSQEKVKAKGYANLPLQVDTNRARFQAMLVYHATVPDQRKKLWDNRAAWERYNVITGWAMVLKVLRGGEIDKICDRIDLLSGYTDSSEVERMDLAKNS